MGATLQELGKLEEAEASYRQVIALKPDLLEAHNNLGATLQELGKFEEAEASYRQAIALKPDFALAHNNLGATLQELGKFEEAEASYRQAIALKPDFAKALLNLGNTIKNLGRERLEEAEALIKQAIALKPDFALAHNNLGGTLKELGKLEEAATSVRQAIILESGFAEAHNNLGGILQELGKLEEAEASLKHSITLRPNYASAYGNLSKTLYIKGDLDSAIENMQKASNIDPDKKNFSLLLDVMKTRKSRMKTKVKVDDKSNIDSSRGLNTNLLILNRAVEAELIENLYGMNFREMEKTRDARFGNGRCSVGFNFMEDKILKNESDIIRSTIKMLRTDLTKIMMEAVKSNIYIYDSFFNILGAGGGSTPHMHMNRLDKDVAFNLGKQKYSLVYYLSVGDQNCSEPGTLKLYDPDEDILPCEGMVVIIPASRRHSAVYGGKTDRVMIGINFYGL